MKKMVLTGGPCSGKSTIMRVLAEEFGSQIAFVPEVATMLLSSGFPVPGRDLEWSQIWQDAFQSAVLPLQTSMEDAVALANIGKELLVCDRGVLDGAAYTPGGPDEFCRRYGFNRKNAMARYGIVVHLESLATVDPDRYGKTGNEIRFEPLDRAQELELATRQAWNGHLRHVVVDGKGGIDGKISQVMGIVRGLLTE